MTTRGSAPAAYFVSTVLDFFSELEESAGLLLASAPDSFDFDDSPDFDDPFVPVAFEPFA